MGMLIALIKVLPEIIRLVRIIETEIPISGMGKEKLDFALEVLAAVGGDVSADLGAKIIAAVVTVFKKTGIFK